MDLPGGSNHWPLKIARWILAALCLGGGWWLIRGAYANAAVVPAFWLSLIALGLLCLAILLLLPEALATAMAPFNALVDSLFFPGGKMPPPGLDHSYRLIDSFREQERWEDLAEACEQILRKHPRELRPYQELLELYADWPEQSTRLAQLRQQARKHLCEEDLVELEATDDLRPPAPSD